mmetsp:Transcript_52561/g.117826  ORF Transcript_52561/g.117826 Transcript_52561/m.117826 type:complete len:240 (+) Transcript_52561:194-913(+)
MGPQLDDDSRKGGPLVLKVAASMPWIQQAVGEDDLGGSLCHVDAPKLQAIANWIRLHTIMLGTVGVKVRHGPIPGREHVGDVVCVLLVENLRAHLIIPCSCCLSSAATRLIGALNKDGVHVEAGHVRLPVEHGHRICQALHGSCRPDDLLASCRNWPSRKGRQEGGRIGVVTHRHLCPGIPGVLEKVVQLRGIHCLAELEGVTDLFEPLGSFGLLHDRGKRSTDGVRAGRICLACVRGH